MLRILLKIRLSYLLVGLYAAVFILAAFVPSDFLAVAFDSGGVTTGPMTVPFIMALGVGVAASRTDKNAESDSFGLVALGSVGPVIAVLLLGLIYRDRGGAFTVENVSEAEDSAALALSFLKGTVEYMKDAAISLLPVLLFFLFFQIVRLRLSKPEFFRIIIGVVYTYAGLVLFLTGANVGFMPVGRILGQSLVALPYRWIILPVGMLIGFFIVKAEPAVHVLQRQVTEMSSGAISERTMRVTLSVGTAVSIGMALLRIILHIPLLYFLIPGYAAACALAFFSPPVFTAIAFDSGGVASGPMTAALLVPLAIGACTEAGGNILTDGFGIVALVAMTPLIAVQVVGVFCKIRMKKHAASIADDTEDIIEL
jgi:intracellular septation protein A